MNPRLLTVKLLTTLIREGRSLSQLLEEADWSGLSATDRAFTRAMCFGVTRHFFYLQFILDSLLRKPLRAKDTDIRCLALMGLYQLIYMRVPDHAAVAETVNIAGKLKKTWAKSILNAVLRNFLRQSDAGQAPPQPPENQLEARFNHPAWLVEALRVAWPESWQRILEANNAQAPMSLRVNQQKHSREEYLATLSGQGLPAKALPHLTMGIRLDQAGDVTALPGFAEGAVSVQDGAAQLAAPLLDPQPGDHILDACAAPGGKTAHLLEYQARAGQVIAIDKSPARLARVDENLQRLGLQGPSAQTLVADATQPHQWWDGRLFDRILLDAPCSATGVIRRHPDIKLLRRDSDIPDLVDTQHMLLTTLWPLLKPGGMLLYSTCSVLPQENARQVAQFLAENNHAHLATWNVAWGTDTGYGQQILPGEDQMDGFFYARIFKQA